MENPIKMDDLGVPLFSVYFFQHIFPFKQQAIGHLCLLIFLPGDQREEAISSAYQGPWCFGWHRVSLGNGVVFFSHVFLMLGQKKT